MDFAYSSFFSYRRNDGNENFYNNLKKIIETEAQNVTNKNKVFYDTCSIKWGNEFDDRIYGGILTSYFFIPCLITTYLHKDNVWCAKELHYALQIEDKIKKQIPNYCYILPILYRGGSDTMPTCISKKNFKDIRQLETSIRTKRDTKALTDFRQYIADNFLESYSLLENEKINLQSIADEIPKLTDEEVIVWINEQKKKIKTIEATQLPQLHKKAEL